MTRKRSLLGFRIFLGVALIAAIYLAMTSATSIINGPSMLDTHKEGDRVLVSRAYWLVGPIERDSIIVAKNPKNTRELVIKRVKYLPGEEVPFQYYPKNVRITDTTYRVPNDSYFVLGDNRAVSEDSREYGPMPFENVIGKVVYPILK